MSGVKFTTDIYCIPPVTLAELCTSLYSTSFLFNVYPDSKVHGANMGPTWDRQDPGGPHVGPMNLAIWVYVQYFLTIVVLKLI